VGRENCEKNNIPMCGINGFNFSDEKLIRKMNDTTKHRGPDDDGFFVSSNWSLGHNRLSIIDLSSQGHQPMFNASKSLAIVFNGEIYNFLDIKKELIGLGYEFTSKTDTEVVLYSYEEWGEKCLEKFNGMFSFAILNNEKQELFLARDRVGIKPLYYYNNDGKFIFSSEIKSILNYNVSRELDRQALNIYFRFLYIPSPLTIFKNIKKLPPAHFAVIDGKGEMRIEKYWSIDVRDEFKDRSVDDLQGELHDKLYNSIEKRLVSDRPVGVFLSGGADSSIIAGVMSKISNKVDTFTAGFEKTEESEKYNNDFYVARKTAKYLNTNHHELVLDTGDVIDNFENTIYHMDEPISNHIQTVNMLLARETSKHVKVVLGGDGGDELFGGYKRYYYNYLLDRIQKIPKFLRNNVLSKSLATALNKKGIYNKINSEKGVNRYFDFFCQKEDMVASFLSPEVNDKDCVVEYFEKNYFKDIYKKDFTKQFMLTDLKTWMPDESLTRSDKMSMSAGLEQRVPFLDHELIEFAFKIPTKYKIGKLDTSIFERKARNYRGKMILTNAMSEYVPDFVLDQPKWGWFSPASKWLRGDMEGFAREILSPSYCKDTKDIFNFDQINTILNDHNSKKQYALNTIWSIMTFQVWYKQFVGN
jgi:asparagine synthase (glutamine-hydrolysing)